MDDMSFAKIVKSSVLTIIGIILICVGSNESCDLGVLFLYMLVFIIAAIIPSNLFR